MIDTAVLVCPREGLPEAALLDLAVAGSGESVLDLVGADVLGVTGSFLVVFFWSLRSGREASGEPSQRAAKTLISIANRDGLCLALWATVLLGRPAWFLWTLAIGSNIYWMVWLAVFGPPRRARVSAK